MGTARGYDSRRNVQEAYYTDGAGLIPTLVWQREGQDFSLHATPWEKWWSTLLRNRYDTFKPIVNALDTVVGHIASISSEKILSNQHPAGFTSHDFTSLYLNYDLVVGNSAEATQGYRRALFTFAIYKIQTGIDGDIVSGEYERPTNNGQAVEPDFSPTDLAAPFQAMFSAATVLMKIGSRGILTLARRKAVKRIGATLFGNKVKTVGVDAAMASRGLRFATWEERMGIPRKHFDAMVQAAKEEKGIAVLRANKKAAIQLIERGAVGKPKSLSIPGFKSRESTGVLTATTPEQIELVRQNRHWILEVKPGQKPLMRMGDQYKELPRAPYWKMENGQVLSDAGHPVVGDYDGVAFLANESPGRLLVPVPKNPVSGDWMSYDWKRFMNNVNSKLDQPRVLHGGSGSYPDLKNGGNFGGFTDDLAYAVFEDGRVIYLQGKAQQQSFFEAFSHESILGSHNPK